MAEKINRSHGEQGLWPGEAIDGDKKNHWIAERQCFNKPTWYILAPHNPNFQ
jgi:hypothetical protein